jgi:hypothetical protein
MWQCEKANDCGQKSRICRRQSAVKHGLDFPDFYLDEDLTAGVME